MGAIAAATVVPTLALTSARLAAAAVPTGFTDSVVLTGLTNPTVVQFANDGRIFVGQKDGQIKVYHGFNTTPTVFADLRSSVHDFWDRGLLGMALAPNFPADPSVYVLYTFGVPLTSGTVWGDGCPTPPGPTTDGCVVSARLSRLTAAGDVMTGSEQPLINDWCQQFPSHSIGTLAFGNDGYLYASGGDGASFNNVDYGQYGANYSGDLANPCGDAPRPAGTALSPPGAEGGALRSQSVNRTDGPTTLDGTIVRIDPATGQAAPGNPFAGSADANKRRVVAYGMRNPFRFTMRPGTNEMWVGDVGWNTWEEVNKVASIGDNVAENFGWPCYEGNFTQSGYQAAGLTQCTALYSAGSATRPVFAYQHGSPAAPSGDTCPLNVGSVISAISFYTGTSYPPAYRGALFFGDHSRNCIWAMLPDANGNPDPGRVQMFESAAGHPVDLKAGPNGDLFYADLEGGSVHRITYNQAPTAGITAQPTSGTAPLTVQFDGSGSSDPEGGTLAFAWDLDGDGAYDDSSAVQPSWTYSSAGTYTARVLVTDPQGANSTASQTITVGNPIANTPPAPVIDTPSSALRWKVGDVITFSGHATDTQDGNLPASALSWQLKLQHCTTGCHTHDLTPQNPSWIRVSSGSFTTPDHDYPSYLELVLTATDSQGLSASTTLRLDPQTVNLTFRTIPGGLKLTIGEGASASTAPFTKTYIVNGLVTVSAPSPQNAKNGSYVFQSWSDGGAQSHTITAPAVNTTYTATYRKR
jgi:glucose/arabinose dehydrogenase/PKD repeat protein